LHCFKALYASGIRQYVFKNEYHSGIRSFTQTLGLSYIESSLDGFVCLTF
jgi:hypothetical protein